MGLLSGLATAVAKPVAKSIVKKADDFAPKMAADVVEEAAPLATKKSFSSVMETPRATEAPLVKSRTPINEDLGVEPPLLAESGKDAFEALGMTAEKKEAWRSVNKKSQRSKLLPEIEDAAQQLSENKITSEEFRRISKDKQPIVPIDKVPEMPTYEDIGGALTDAQVKKGIVGLNTKIPAGERVSSRLDIPAYNDYDTWVVSLHDGTKKSGAAVAYAKTAVLRNVEFVSDPKVALDIARRKPLASGGRMGKATIARIFGDWVPHNPENAKTFAEKIFNNPEWTQVGMNPYRASYFYDKTDGLPVTFAEEVVQIGPLVMAKNVKKTTPDNPMFKTNQKDMTSPTFAEGGAVQQTGTLLADGGMMEEGGTVDPVSGNDVPTGSLKEEVRDDVNAKLSPGEFVIPADVVRYIGLEKLMKIRDAAKEGLKRMEEVGQMGNAEEAPKADEAFEENDEEFEGSIDEIMSEVDDEEKTTNMAVGGYITGAYTEGMMSNPAVDVRYFKHPDGRVIYITHINGKPMTAVPEGFTQTDKPVEQKIGKAAEEKAAVAAAADSGGGGSDSGAGGRGVTGVVGGGISGGGYGGGPGGNYGPGQGISNAAQSAALTGLALAQNPVVQFMAPLVSSLVGWGAGKVADQQLDAMGRAMDALSAIDQTIGGQVVSLSDESGNISSFSNQGLTDAFDRANFGVTSAEMDAARTPETSYSFTAEQPGTPAPSPSFGSEAGPAAGLSNEYGSTNETAAADNSGNTRGETSSESGVGNPAESSANDSGTGPAGADNGGFGDFAKGGFVSKKNKPVATKSKKGLASRK